MADKAKKVIDWESIEREYVRGLRSLRDIGAEFGTCETNIRHRAKRFGWPRDLGARIRLKAEELLRKEDNAGEFAKGKVKEQDDRLEIQLAAQKQVEISKKHRRQISTHTDLRDKLLSECIHQADNVGDYERLAELLDDGTSKEIDKLQAIFKNVISLPGRVETFRKLTDTTKVLIGLEREAYGISDNANGNANQPPQQMSISERIATLPAKEKAAKVLGILGLIKAAAEAEALKNGSQ